MSEPLKGFLLFRNWPLLSSPRQGRNHNPLGYVPSPPFHVACVCQLFGCPSAKVELPHAFMAFCQNLNAVLISQYTITNGKRKWEVVLLMKWKEVISSWMFGIIQMLLIKVIPLDDHQHCLRVSGIVGQCVSLTVWVKVHIWESVWPIVWWRLMWSLTCQWHYHFCQSVFQLTQEQFLW